MAGLFHEFLAHLKETGVAKTSHFEVSIPVAPEIVGTSVAEAHRLLSFRCEATELPGRQLVTQENRIYGPVYKTPYQSLYQEITLNFLETKDLFVRRFFELWMDRIFTSYSNKLSYPDEYRYPLVLTQYDIMSKDSDTKEGGSGVTGRNKHITTSLTPVASWVLYYAFPTAVNQMPVSWTEDGFHRVSVTIAFEYYLIGTPTEPPKKITPSAPTTKQTKGSAKHN